MKVLKAGDSSATLKDELTKYENMMKSHLVEEEVECLPLCRAYFTPQEIAKKVQQIMSKATKCELGSFINTSKWTVTSQRYIGEVSIRICSQELIAFS